jgi:hypothetical protein
MIKHCGFFLLLLLLPRPAAAVPRIIIDDAKIASAGIRKLPPSKRLVLYTDLPSSEEIDRLPAVFDLAFPQWCEFFHVDPAQHAAWKMTAFVMKDRTRFEQAGLLPAELPPFPNGFTMDDYLWVCNKHTDYYRRHLLLHEGTHGFMITVLRGLGAPWYMEGTAELLGTHFLDTSGREGLPRLTMNYMPANRDEAPDWGRVRTIKDLFAARQAVRLQTIIDYPVEVHAQKPTEAYAWSWAAAAFLDRHPRYHDRFRSLDKLVRGPDFNDKFYRLFQPDWQELSEEWQVFVAGMEYGYDVARTAIDFARGQPLPAAGAAIHVAADRGWQNSGLRLERGGNYKLTASGRYQVGTKPKIWWCEPGGVSIRYYQGRPLGQLLAAVRPDKGTGNGVAAFLRPTVVGLGEVMAPEQSGTLFFKINHSAAELKECAGELKVSVRRE